MSWIQSGLRNGWICKNATTILLLVSIGCLHLAAGEPTEDQRRKFIEIYENRAESFKSVAMRVNASYVLREADYDANRDGMVDIEELESEPVGIDETKGVMERLVVFERSDRSIYREFLLSADGVTDFELMPSLKDRPDSIQLRQFDRCWLSNGVFTRRSLLAKDRAARHDGPAVFVEFLINGSESNWDQDSAVDMHLFLLIGCLWSKHHDGLAVYQVNDQMIDSPDFVPETREGTIVFSFDPNPNWTDHRLFVFAEDDSLSFPTKVELWAFGKLTERTTFRSAMMDDTDNLRVSFETLQFVPEVKDGFAMRLRGTCLFENNARIEEFPIDEPETGDWMSDLSRPDQPPFRYTEPTGRWYKSWTFFVVLVF